MIDEIAEKISNLKRELAAASKAKASRAGQLEAKKQEFDALVQEIRDAGFDPKQIGQERDRVRVELEEMIEAYSKSLQEAGAALGSFPK